jgi:hypothetical protein
VAAPSVAYFIDLDPSTPAPIYISTNASTSWRQTTAPSNYWSSVACSTDGTKLVAASFYDLIYISPDAGVTWTPASAPST